MTLHLSSWFVHLWKNLFDRGSLKAITAMAWTSALEENPGAVCKQGAEQNIFGIIENYIRE